MSNNDSTPYFSHAPIPMRLVLEPDGTDDPEEGIINGLHQRGDFYWEFRDGKRVMVVAIPCTAYEMEDGKHFARAEFTIEHPNEWGASWDWNVNEYSPTLTPELHAKGIWIGQCVDGFLIELPIEREAA